MKRCNESFTIWRDGTPVSFTVGQLVDDKHPILKSHGHLFTKPEAAGGQDVAPTLKPVEMATAAPGERRTLTPPAAPAAGGEGKLFDPGEHSAPEVLDYLESADEEERARVLAAEAAGRNRGGIVGDSARK